MSGLWRNRDFQLLCAGQGLSQLGSQTSSVAIPLLVLRETGSPLAVGVVEAVWTTVQVAAFVPAGVIVDRYDRRAIMVSCDLGRLAATVALAAALLTGSASLTLFLLYCTVLGLLGAPFTAAGPAALREIVPGDGMVAAVSVLQARSQVTYILGPMFGGLLYMVSPSLPLWFDVFSFAMSALSIMALRTSLRVTATATAPTLAEAQAEATGRRRGMAGDLATAARFLRSARYLRRQILIAALLKLAFDGLMLAIIIVASLRSASGLSIGVIIGLTSVGSLAGSLLAPRLNGRFAVRPMVIVATLTCACLVPAMALTGDGLVLAALLAACSVLVTAASVLLAAQQVLMTPAELQGRVHSAANLVNFAFAPAGTVLAGWMLGVLPHAGVFLVFGAFLWAVALADLVIPAAPPPAAPPPETREPTGLATT
ncbi:MFS transporter [Spirillospora sp. NPDC048911]|uniref:MFS transporter n=1 Tax=Spirillospora sp. NPDC048911 TaxID=3364527 RepID=UPI003723AEC2